MFGWWPRVSEVAGDAGVWAVGRSGDAVEEPLEKVGGGEALGEGEGLVAKLGFASFPDLQATQKRGAIADPRVTYE